MPRSHMEFISGLPLNATFGDYFFVHAGARPGLALADQNPRDFLWIRHDFLLSDHRFEKKIVHGHTPAEAPEFLDNRINLDTRAYASGQLTAAVFEEDRVSLL